MADYYPLIARAVAGLDKNTGEQRRALYERARTALVAQLRGVQPPLEESEITRERLALEEAIRRIEAESARQAREAPRPPPPRRPEPPQPQAPQPEPPPPSARPAPPPPQLPRAAPQPPRDPAAERRSLSDEALKGFRETVADPAHVSERRPEPEPRRPERQIYTPPPPPAQPPQTPAQPPHPQQYAQHDYDQLEPRVREENLWALPLDNGQPPPADLDEQRGPVRPRPQPRSEPIEPVEELPRRSYAGVISAILVLALLGGAAAVAWWQRDAVIGGVQSVIALVRSPSTPATRDTSPTRPKIADRIGQPGTAPAGGPPVAQRVVLYEEDPDDPQGKRFLGSAIWRTEMVPAAPGRPAELAVRADVEVPERRMTMTWSLRRNSDPALPASHTIEIMFNLPADSPAGGVQNVPGVLMKQAEQTRGVPLAGLAVKVTPGFFLIGLSSLESDMQRNIQLLKERSWFDVPIVYNNNRRAILAMEKGTPGEKAFADAFVAWKQ